MIDIFTGLALVGAAVSLAACLAIAYGRRIAAAMDALHRIPQAHLAAFFLFATIATLSAQKTNSPPRGGNGGNVELKMDNVELRNSPQFTKGEHIHNSPFYILHSQFTSPADVARGYRLDYVFTNAAYSYAMPTNGIRYDKWWKRGAYEDVFRLDLGGMTFPLVDELLSSFWVYSWGMAGAHLGTASNRLVATGTPMSAVPGLSQFWSAALPDGARRLTWQDFALNRDTNNLVSAQLELFPNGDFIARSNEVMRVYRRVNPDDWDDDGDPNETDADPYVAGESTFGPEQQLPEGANSNAYCWVDLVVSGAASLVTFSGNGASNLSDPSFIALPGETNRVLLLIGKEYHVSSRMPICCVGRSDYAIEVSQESPTSLSIIWPVTIEPVAMRSGESFSMSVVPDFLGGGFTWTNCCCSISSSGNSFTYSCDENCHCTGCAALGYYAYEGFTLPAHGGSCGCGETSGPGGDWIEEEDDPAPHAAAASASFSKSAVIFEDGYWNTPSNWVGRHSTTTELHCVAYGGPNGGHVRFEITGENKLERVSGSALPVEQDVGSGKMIDFTITYKGQLPSSAAEDIVVTTTFTENAEGATPSSSQSKLTSVKVELEAIYVAPENTNQNRHVYGVGEKVKFLVTPNLSEIEMSVDKADSTDNVTAYDTFGGELQVNAGGDVNVYTCPASDTTPDITISFTDAEHHPSMTVVEPQYVITPVATRTGTFWPGDVVMGTLCTSNYIGPMTVSFRGVKMVEIPCTNAVSPSGYFSTTNFDGNLTHSFDAGAGVAKRIGEGNYWTIDSAGRDTPYANWSAGQLTWKIPIGWKRMLYDDDNIGSAEEVDYALYDDDKSRPLLIGNSEDAYTQIFTILSSGESSVEKFGYRLSRSRWSFSGEVIKIQ